MTYQQETPEEKLPLSYRYGPGKVAYFVIFALWAVLGYLAQLGAEDNNAWWRLALGMGMLMGPWMIVVYPIIVFSLNLGDRVDEWAEERGQRNGRN